MSLATQKLLFGVYTDASPGGDAAEKLALAETKLNAKLSLNNFYKWSSPTAQMDNAYDSLVQLTEHDRVPMITWEPMVSDSDAGRFGLQSIIDGHHDDYIKSWANGLRELGRRVVLRPMHEMNGDWYPWCGDSHLFNRAWWRIRKTFLDANASNVDFIWCPNRSNKPNTNYMLNYWVGGGESRDKRGCDLIGLDLYNGHSGTWRSFSELLQTPYNLVTAKSNLPIWICETGCPESNEIEGAEGQSKDQWIRDMWNAEGFEQVEGLFWLDTVKNFDWRLDTSADAMIAMRNGLRESTAWLAAPTAPRPPMPTKVEVTRTGPGRVTVSWRIPPAFTRGHYVYARSMGGEWKLLAIVPKPELSTDVELPGDRDYEFVVYSYTKATVSFRSDLVRMRVT